MPLRGTSGGLRELRSVADAFVRAVGAGEGVDPIGLAADVDAMATCRDGLGADSPIVLACAAVATAPEAFRIRRAVELARMILEFVDVGDTEAWAR